MSKKTYIEKLRVHSLGMLKKEPNKKLTKHESEVEAAVANGSFGCKTSLVQKFASAFMGVDYETIHNKKDYVNGEIVVPIDNSNSHDYTLKVPVCPVSGTIGFQVEKGGTGNNLPTHFDGTLRAATEKEINEFYDHVSKNEKVKNSFLKMMKENSGIKED